MEKWGNKMEIRLQQWLDACQPHHVRMLSRESSQFKEVALEL